MEEISNDESLGDDINGADGLDDINLADFHLGDSPGPCPTSPLDEDEPIELLSYPPVRIHPFTTTVEDEDSDNDDVQYGSDSDIPLEDPEIQAGEFNENDIVDWEALKKEIGVSSWDQSGAEYEVHAAQIAQKMDEYDQAICWAFAFKHTTYSTDSAYKKIPFAFRADPPLPNLARLRSRVCYLSGFKPEIYHCCPNSCCCYVGPHADLEVCPFCNEGRYRPGTTKPRKTFTYIPLVPRLKTFALNQKLAKTMQYRHDYHSGFHQMGLSAQDGITADIFDGSHYKNLCQQNIKVGQRVVPDKYFSDARDVALGLSTDGFAPFNKRQKTAWPLIIFNYNLPPDLRFHVENIMALGIIPGPRKPKDIDSFLWPFMQELFRLAQGVQALDILSAAYFLLRAFLIVVFGDIPAVSLVMRMKGHNGISPCRMCEIKGLRVPGARATTHYVPLDRSLHPDVHGNPQQIKRYDPRNLPLRSHTALLEQARAVDLAKSSAEADRLAKKSGIKGTPILSYLNSLSFPLSFPYDFMHLIWENLIPNLILHWTGAFKGLDDGEESYRLANAIWEAIGAKSEAAGAYIPSAYGARVPNIAKDKKACTAETWSFWTLYIGPVLPRKRFNNSKYYCHFVSLVVLLNTCLQFEITDKEVETVHEGFVNWVSEYEKIYYQNKPERLSACPVTVHALLHIANSIKAMGPVWCYWAFPMERYCGRLKPSVRSRRFPYASLDRYVLEDSQLTQIKAFYDMAEELTLREPRLPPETREIWGSFKDLDAYPSCVLLLPRKKDLVLEEGTLKSIRAALSTRFNLPLRAVRQHLQHAQIEEWGTVRRIDSDEGDTIHTSNLDTRWEDKQDATFVRVEMLEDKHEKHKRKRVKLVPKTFYGQLEHLFLIRFPALNDADSSREEDNRPIILAAIRECKLEKDDPDLAGLDIHLYNTLGALHYLDVTCIQALIAAAV
ncbi:hypothetical protein NLJ89_g10843 [Agrocybe chaxingu]|uniref:Transposase family Tnp2 protein n=1 Tax=Agrocybe chaxingu TaxID=84603 RepID=A0A9W8MNJ2_9AGAR|nr:hypothetical protein NLJ89_g10843 [Agrocybe chaxingu]